MSSDLFVDHVPLMRPWLEEEEVEAVREVLLSGWISLGPRVAEFEACVAEWIGVPHAVATNAATSALHLTMRTLGIERDDQVLMPSFTCMANANAVLMAGAQPVFADIDPRTFNLDPADVEKRITPRVKGLMIVDQIGLPADLDGLRAVAQRHGIALLEDAATAFGASYRGGRLGSHGIPACFSFHPRKMITTGEGGMLVTDDAEQAERARQLRSTGASVSDLARHQARGAILQSYHEPGYNYRLTDIQAAIGLVQMRRVETMLEQRRALARYYDERIAEIEELEGPFVPEEAEHCYSSYCVKLTDAATVEVDRLTSRMADLGVSCRRGIQPLHHEPVFASTMQDLALPHTEHAARSTFFLPIFPGLTQAQQDFVVENLERCLAE